MYIGHKCSRLISDKKIILDLLYRAVTILTRSIMLFGSIYVFCNMFLKYPLLKYFQDKVRGRTPDLQSREPRFESLFAIV